MQRTLVGHAVDELADQVALGARDGLQQRRVLAAEGEQLLGEGAVAVEQLLDPPRGQAVARRELVDLVGQGVVALGPDQRDLLGDAVGDARPQVDPGGVGWSPQMEEGERERLYRNWKKAVTKTLDWVDDDVD